MVILNCYNCSPSFENISVLRTVAILAAIFCCILAVSLGRLVMFFVKKKVEQFEMKDLSIVNRRKSGWATQQYAIESSFVSAEDVEAGCHVMRRCALSFKMAAKSSDLFLFGEDLDIFLDFMDDDEEIQEIFDEKLMRYVLMSFLSSWKYNSFNFCAEEELSYQS